MDLFCPIRIANAYTWLIFFLASFVKGKKPLHVIFMCRWPLIVIWLSKITWPCAGFVCVFNSIRNSTNNKMAPNIISMEYNWTEWWRSNHNKINYWLFHQTHYTQRTNSSLVLFLRFVGVILFCVAQNCARSAAHEMLRAWKLCAYKNNGPTVTVLYKLNYPYFVRYTEIHSRIGEQKRVVTEQKQLKVGWKSRDRIESEFISVIRVISQAL